MKNSFAFSLLTVKSVDEEKRVIRGMATTPEPDRDGDIVEPLGVQFRNPSPLLWMHQRDLPVGSVVFGKPTAKGVSFEASFPIVAEPSHLRARIEEAWNSVKAGLVRAVSIGFKPQEYAVIEETGGLRFTRTDVFELSLVTVPANPGATIQQIKAFDAEARAALGQKLASAAKAPTPGASGTIVKLTKLKAPQEGHKMRINQKIKQFTDELEVKNARMVELAEKSAEAGETFDAAETEEFDTLTKEVSSLKDHVARLKLAEKASVEGATAISEADGAEEKKAAQVRGKVHAQVKATPATEKGIMFTRYAMCKLAAKGNPMMALSLAKQHYGNHDSMIKVLELEAGGARIDDMMKAAVEAGTTLHSTWAAPLVDFNNFSGDFIEFLRPKTIIGQFGVGSVPSLRRVPFNIKVPMQTSAGDAQWVGEGAPKPLTKFNFDNVELRWSKIAAIAVLTQELIRFSNPAAEELVRDSLAEAVIARMDHDFVDPTKAAVANVSPASITNGVTPISASGTDAAAVRADIKALWKPFVAARNPARSGVYIMDSMTALSLSLMENPLGQSEFEGLTTDGGTFLGRPVLVSDHIARDTGGGMIILANASDIYLADDGQVTLDASEQASLQMLDNPTNNSGSGTATTMVSMWQTNSVAIRAERYVNWKKRRTSAVSYISDVNYGDET